MVFSQTVCPIQSTWKLYLFVHSQLKRNFVSCVQNLVHRTNHNQNMTSCEHVPKPNTKAHAFDQSKRQKFVSRSVCRGFFMRSALSRTWSNLKFLPFLSVCMIRVTPSQLHVAVLLYWTIRWGTGHCLIRCMLACYLNALYLLFVSKLLDKLDRQYCECLCNRSSGCMKYRHILATPSANNLVISMQVPCGVVTQDPRLPPCIYKNYPVTISFVVLNTSIFK